MPALLFPTPPSRHWMLPFLWVLMAPLATVPLSVVLLDELATQCPRGASFFGFYDHTCEPRDLLLAYLPGAVLPLAFAFALWDRVPKAAAIIAGALGTVRFVVPLALVAASGAGVKFDPLWEWNVLQGDLTTGLVTGPASFASEASVALYLVTVVAFAAYGWREHRLEW